MARMKRMKKNNFSQPAAAIPKTERNVNNYHNAPLALFRNSNTPWRIPHGRSETARAIRMISVRGAAALGLLCTFLSERIPRTGCRIIVLIISSALIRVNPRFEKFQCSHPASSSRYISVRGAAALGLLCTFLSEKPSASPSLTPHRARGLSGIRPRGGRC